MRKVLGSAMLTLAAVAAGCDRADEPTGPAVPEASRSAAAEHAQGRGRGIEGDFARIERDVPGFGGYFYDAEGNLSAYVTDPRHEPGARAALARVAAGRPAQARGPRGGAVRVLRGRFSFTQLSGWHDRLSGLFALPAVVFTDLDESRNLLRVGVASGAAAGAVRAEAARLGIPPEALEVEVSEPARTGASLSAQSRPVEGALGIVRVTFGGNNTMTEHFCTLGYVVYRAGTPALLTNSHCTDNQGAVTGHAFYQPYAAQIATETVDPAYWPGYSGGACPAGYVCRHSDAALAQFTSGTSWHLGYVARTQWYGTTSPGSTEIDANDPRMQVTGEQLYPTQGQYLDKIGRTTGWTYGPVTATCVNVRQNLSSFFMICQDYFQAEFEDGDSGSPVFVFGGSSVTAAGIAWGQSGGNVIFSSVVNLESDLGDLVFY